MSGLFNTILTEFIRGRQFDPQRGQEEAGGGGGLDR